MSIKLARVRISRRSFLKGAAGVVGIAAAASCAPQTTPAPPTPAPGTPAPATPTSPPKRVVYTEQYGGNWEEHFKTSIFPRFTEETGIEVVTVPGAGSKIARVDQMVKSGKVEIDVFATDASDVIKGKNLGLWEKLLESEIPNVKKVDPRFGEVDISVPNITYWMILFYLTDKIDKPDDSWEVMWDPTYRSWVTCYNDPGWSNIFPITAATLGISQVELKDPAQLEKVWEKLDGLKDQVKRWWTGGADFQAIVAAGEAWTGEGWNGRIFDSQDKGVAIDGIWPKEGGYLAIDHWVVTKGTPRREEAMALVNFLLEPENQKKTAETLSFGPTTVGTEELLDEKTRNRTYGPPGAMDNALIEDWQWYFERPEEIEERWREWIAL